MPPSGWHGPLRRQHLRTLATDLARHRGGNPCPPPRFPVFQLPGDPWSPSYGRERIEYFVAIQSHYRRHDGNEDRCVNRVPKAPTAMHG
jgi:hypothetical protein